jgi:hypothetical protein
MNCSGSVALIHALKSSPGYIEDDPDYRRDGVEAHRLAAYCLGANADTWEAPLDAFPSLTEDMLAAVQVYLDFTRSLPGRERHIEARVHRPEFHPMFYGTLDFASVMVLEDVANFVDYKHGQGVLVEVENNPQLLYYAYGFIAELKEDYPDGMIVRLHVCQPRGVHPDGPIRTWDTTAGAIREWAHTILRPAMARTVNDRYLSVGEWCRFCPAKVICPAMTSLATEVALDGSAVSTFTPERLGDFYAKAQVVKMLVKAIEVETERRVLGGEAVPGVKAVQKISRRVFKDGVPLEATFGEAAWAPRELLSPPAVEKLPDGKTFVAEWAFTPDTGLTVALESDRRSAVSVKSGAETFDGAVKTLDNPTPGE